MKIEKTKKMIELRKSQKNIKNWIELSSGGGKRFMIKKLEIANAEIKALLKQDRLSRKAGK